MLSASAKKNARRRALKRNEINDEVIVSQLNIFCQLPNPNRLWAALVILKNILWFKITLKAPFFSLYKKAVVDKNVENGKFRGLLINWHVVKYQKGTFSITGFINKRCITTSSIEIDYFDGRDRFVLTFSGSVYRLAENDELLVGDRAAARKSFVRLLRAQL